MCKYKSCRQKIMNRHQIKEGCFKTTFKLQLVIAHQADEQLRRKINWLFTISVNNFIPSQFILKLMQSGFFADQQKFNSCDFCKIRQMF